MTAPPRKGQSVIIKQRALGGRQGEELIGQTSIPNECVSIMLNIFSCLSADSTLSSSLDEDSWWLNVRGTQGVNSRCKYYCNDLMSVVQLFQRYNKSTTWITLMQMGLAMFSHFLHALTGFSWRAMTPVC